MEIKVTWALMRLPGDEYDLDRACTSVQVAALRPISLASSCQVYVSWQMIPPMWKLKMLELSTD
jgi:hypothetical protein